MLKNTPNTLFNENLETISDVEMAMIATQLNDIEPSTASNAFDFNTLMDATLSIHISLFLFCFLAVAIAYLWGNDPITFFKKLSR